MLLDQKLCGSLEKVKQSHDFSYSELKKAQEAMDKKLKQAEHAFNQHAQQIRELQAANEKNVKDLNDLNEFQSTYVIPMIDDVKLLREELNELKANKRMRGE